MLDEAGLKAAIAAADKAYMGCYAEPFYEAVRAAITAYLSTVQGEQKPVAKEWRALEDGVPSNIWQPDGYGDRAGWQALVNRNPAKYQIVTRDLYTHTADRDGVEVGGWRTIETAPKDAPEWVFLYVPGHGPARAIWRRKRKWWESHSTGREITKATHWQPLPTPPASALKGGE